MNRYDEAACMISASERVVVTAANGLSISEGLNLFAQDAWFAERFPWMIHRHGTRSIIQAAFTDLPDDEYWALWSELIGEHVLDYRPTDVMHQLLRAVGDRDPVVITTNGEGHFQLAGFPSEGVFEVEGNWSTMQCAVPCHSAIYPSLEVASSLRGRSMDGHLPKDALPRCPRCGGPMRIRMRTDGSFVPDAGSMDRLRATLSGLSDSRVTVLELGVGPRNRLLKAPMMRLVAASPGWRYITVNTGELHIPDDIAGRSIGIDDDIHHALSEIAARRSV